MDYQTPYPYIYIFIVAVLITVGVVFRQVFEHVFANPQMRTQWVIWGSVWGGLAVFFFFFKIYSALTCPFKKRKFLGAYHTTIFKLSHFILHFCLGLFAPALWPLTAALGVGWEWLECYSFEWSRFCEGNCLLHCSGAPDIVVNLVALCSGLFANKLFLQ